MSATNASRAGKGRIRKGALALALLAGVAVTPIAVILSSQGAGASPITAWSATSPTLASITDQSGTTCSSDPANRCTAPWNEWQGDGGSGESTYQNADLFPTYTPGGNTATAGGPNLSVSPAASTSSTPYQSGEVGTPGPLDGYCGPGSNSAESTTSSTTGSPVRMPTGVTLPLAPAYFPHVISDPTLSDPSGTLLGYFDYRPKDADEALVAATSTDGGQSWTYAGEALEEDPGYCPTVDINDDGEGHANLIDIGGTYFLYTLPRAAGDASGVGMISHALNATPSAADPFGGLPASEEVGVDPDAFATTTTPVSSTSTSIPVTTTGSQNSPEQLVDGAFVDLTHFSTPTPAEVINCSGTFTSTSLTTCTSSTAQTVTAGDLIEQVIGFISAQTPSGSLTVPAGPNNGAGSLGAANVDISPTSSAASQSSGSSNLGFTLPLTGSTVNANAPNRLYVDGPSGAATVYCTQSNNNPTTKVEDCTTGPGGSTFTLATGQLLLSDPIVPRTAYESDTASGGMTSGLDAPDGIVGTLPSYPCASGSGCVPSGATIVMYTQKELNYYLAGDSTNAVTLNSTTGQTINFIAGPYVAQDMPSPSSVTSGNPVTVEMGLTTTSSNSTGAVEPVTCTSLTEAGASSTLGGCTVPSGDTADVFEQAKTYVGAPGAATVPQSTLALTGEGSASNVVKLYKNNEDLTVLRAAYTTNGYTFSDSGLSNNGIISDCTTGADSGTPQTTAGCESPSGTYQGINDPISATSPSSLNGYAANEGTSGGNNGTDSGSQPGGDVDEMRWAGSAGSIITNPDGSYGLFLSGAWAADGDSDAFNQIFYSSSTDGQHWTVPVPVISTDYTFSASSAQDQAQVNGHDDPAGISEYYEGRAYGPSVIQNSDGTLTMVFAGYRFPKSIVSAGTTLGTGSNTWTVDQSAGVSDLTMYRNILTTTLTPSSASGVGTPTTPTIENIPSSIGYQGSFTAAVSTTSDGSASVTSSTPSVCTASGTAVSIVGVGTCTLTPAVASDSSYMGATGNAQSFTVSPAPYPVTVTGSQTYGGSPTFAASPSSGPTQPYTGSVTCTTVNGGTSITPTLSAGGSYTLDSASCSGLSLTGSDATNYTLTLTGSTFTVNQATSSSPTISNLPSSGTYGGGFTADVTSTGDGADSVTSSTPSVCTANGLAVSYVGVGTCTLTAHTAAGTNFGAADGGPQSFTVSPAPYPVTVTGSQTYGGSPTFAASPSSGPTQPLSGSVTCTTVDGGTVIAPTLPAGGTDTIDGASCSGLSLTGSDATNYTLTYSGSSFTVSPAPYPVTVTGSQTYGGSPTFAASPSSGPTQPYTGSVTCTTVNGGTSITPTLSAGGSYALDSASCSGLSLTGSDATNYTLTLTGSTFTVNQATSSSPTISNLPSSGTYGGGFTADVTSTGDGADSVTSSTPSVCTASGLAVSYVGVGTCTLTAHVAAGTNEGSADGSPQSFSVAAGTTSTVVTSSANPSVTGQPVTFTATVSAVAPAAGTPTGSVRFTLSDPAPTKGPGHLPALSCGNGGTSADTVALSNGTAVCTISSGLTLAQSPVTVTVSYAGSADFISSMAPGFTQTVDTSPSMVTISAKANPTVTSKTASFSAVVAAASPGAGDPTGTVTWTITSTGGTVVPCKSSNVTVNKKTGKTTCSVATGELFAASGPYTVSVAYSGDADFSASTGTFTQNISQTTSKTKVAVSPPAASGSPATITATVSGVPASAGTPTGTVTFAITATGGAAVNCDTSNTASLSSGTAACTVTSALVLTGSPYSVVATYNGDGNFTSSASGAKTIRVPR